jgi:phage shock protein PspC (stress-responsive transcriptional regulator)
MDCQFWEIVLAILGTAGMFGVAYLIAWLMTRNVAPWL